MTNTSKPKPKPKLIKQKETAKIGDDNTKGQRNEEVRREMRIWM